MPKAEPNNGNDINAFVLRGRVMMWATTLVAAAISAALILSFGVVAFRYADLSIEFIKRLAASWFPAAFFLWAIWSLRSMFKTLASGGPIFQSAITKAVSRVGWALTVGAVSGFVLTPYTTTGSSHMVGAFALLLVPSMALGVVGLSMVAVARLLDRAARIEAQNNALKTTLNEFI